MTPRYLKHPPQASAAIREMTIEGVIGEDVSASDVRKGLASVPAGAPLLIRINSPGGSVTEGMAIHAILKGHKGKKTCVVEGLAASIASVIMCACDEIRVARGAFVMIHQAHAGVEGGADDLEEMAGTLRKMNAEILGIYTARTGKDEAELAKLIDRRDHYMTAEEAVSLGLADKVATAQATFAAKAVARLTNPPESLRAQIKGKSAMDEEEVKALAAQNAALKAEVEALKAAAKAKAEDDDEEEEGDEPAHAEEDDDKDEDKKQAKAIAALAKTLTGKRSSADVQSALAVMIATGTGNLGAVRASAVAEAMRSGKLPPALKAWALGAPEKAWDSYLASMSGKAIIPMGATFQPPAKAPEAVASAPVAAELTAAEKRVAKALGKSPEEMIALRGVKPVIAGAEKSEE